MKGGSDMAKGKYLRSNEIDELDQTYRSITGRNRKSKKESSASTVLLLVALALTAVFMVFCFMAGRLGQMNRKLPDVTVAAVDLSGMTRVEAAQALQIPAKRYLQEDMVIRINGEEFRLTPQETGAQLDLENVLDAAYDAQPDTLDYLSLNRIYLEQVFSQLNETYNSPARQTAWEYQNDTRTLTIVKGSPEYGLDLDMLREAVLEAYRQNRFLVEYSCSIMEPEPLDLSEIHGMLCSNPVDAVMDPVDFSITPEINGYGFDIAQVQRQLDALPYGQKLEVPLQDIPAEITYESLSATLYRDVLGSAATPHIVNANRTENLRLACLAINGMILLPGEQFDYNEALGERTEKKGYKPAASYVNGATVDTVGGGICQVASTLYYCALHADLQIDRRSPHGYAPDYLPLGMDATVSWGGPNFKFTNSTNYPIRIEAYVEDGHVFVSLFGTDEKDYVVKMEYELLKTVDYQVVYRELPPDNPDGYTDGQVLVTPYTGYQVKSYKCRYDKETGILLSREFEANSNYSSRDKVICRIVDPSEVTEETAPPAENP